MVVIQESDGFPLLSSPSPNASSTSLDRLSDDYSLPHEQETLSSCKQLLQNKLFVGHYQERRFVELLSTYRDVVVIHKSEVDLIKDLDIVKEKLIKLYWNKSLWFGYTAPHSVGSTSGHTLWVKIHDLPFGHYWFQIKQIKFESREIILRLKMIRPLQMSDTTIPSTRSRQEKLESYSNRESSRGSARSSKSEQVVNGDWTDRIPTIEECVDAIVDWKNTIVPKVFDLLITYITFSNVVSSIRFMIALFMAAVAGMIHAVQCTGDFSIKFIQESTVFIKAATPIVLGVIDFFSKLVGGMYILVAMMWRGRSEPPNIQRQVYRTQYAIKDRERIPSTTRIRTNYQ